MLDLADSRFNTVAAITEKIKADTVQTFFSTFRKRVDGGIIPVPALLSDTLFPEWSAAL